MLLRIADASKAVDGFCSREWPTEDLGSSFSQSVEKPFGRVRLDSFNERVILKGLRRPRWIVSRRLVVSHATILALPNYNPNCN